VRRRRRAAVARPTSRRCAADRRPDGDGWGRRRVARYRQGPGPAAARPHDGRLVDGTSSSILGVHGPSGS
jgi:hypothetical protein